jgi:hypothetical protein
MVTITRRRLPTPNPSQGEIDGLLTAFERELLGGSRLRAHDAAEPLAHGQPSEHVLRLAAATAAAAARFRAQAAVAAQNALQVYDEAARQAVAATRATQQALELQAAAEKHSEEGNLALALEAIRKAHRLREESVEAARRSRDLQIQYKVCATPLQHA